MEKVGVEWKNLPAFVGKFGVRFTEKRQASGRRGSADRDINKKYWILTRARP